VNLSGVAMGGVVEVAAVAEMTGGVVKINNFFYL
jgi:hypothetical protein